MSQINLSNWEIEDDAPNDRIVIRSKITGNELELHESGELVSEDIDNSGDMATNTINGDDIVTSSAGKDYEVQKDGTDGSGVINFKTS